MLDVILIGMLYHYTISALLWAAEEIETALSAIAKSGLPSEFYRGCEVLQSKAMEYRQLAEEYKPKVYWQDGSSMGGQLAEAFDVVSCIVHQDICNSIRLLRSLEKEANTNNQ